MRERATLTRSRSSPKLWERSEDGRPAFFTEAAGTPPVVYGERTVATPTTTLRRWEPGRSKLGAALAKGWTDPLPRPGERWLYLGAATGTTASHVADLVTPKGAVYAVEKSLRPFARLLRLAEAYPNLLPILGDARRPELYLGTVPPVDGLYLDVAQPDQVDIAWANARLYLRGAGALLLVLKTSSMGRGREPRSHLAHAEARLAQGFELVPSLGLDPFHRRHFLVAGSPTRRLFQPEALGAATPPRPPRRPAGRRS
ncbi:MAG: fibrillarin-like rRNA/tRNA 2'-O-methyltransferase [Thermoplasmata archaeon]